MRDRHIRFRPELVAALAAIGVLLGLVAAPHLPGAPAEPVELTPPSLSAPPVAHNPDPSVIGPIAP